MRVFDRIFAQFKFNYSITKFVVIAWICLAQYGFGQDMNRAIQDFGSTLEFTAHLDQFDVTTNSADIYRAELSSAICLKWRTYVKSKNNNQLERFIGLVEWSSRRNLPEWFEVALGSYDFGKLRLDLSAWHAPDDSDSGIIKEVEIQNEGENVKLTFGHKQLKLKRTVYDKLKPDGFFKYVCVYPLSNGNLLVAMPDAIGLPTAFGIACVNPEGEELWTQEVWAGTPEVNFRSSVGNHFMTIKENTDRICFYGVYDNSAYLEVISLDGRALVRFSTSY